MYEVLGAVIDLQGKWTDILAGLRLPPSLQSTIKAEHSTNTRSCLQAVLLAWLSKSYDVEKHGPPSWRTLVKAVADPIGGADVARALKIAEKHLGNNCIQFVKNVIYYYCFNCSCHRDKWHQLSSVIFQTAIR